MSHSLLVIWIVTIVTELAVILRVASRLVSAYPLFLLWMVADFVYQIVMLGIWVSPAQVTYHWYTALWGLFEVILVLAQIFVCYEAVRAVHRYQSEVIFVTTVLAAVFALIVYAVVRQPQYYLSILEPATTAKGIVDVLLFCVLVALAEGKFGQFKVQYAWALAGYFGTMGVVNLFCVHQLSVVGRISPVPRALTIAVPGIFFLAALVIFRETPKQVRA